MNNQNSLIDVRNPQSCINTSVVESGASTGNTVDMVLHFSDIPLVSLNNAAFGAFFAAVTLTGDVHFNLGGSADVIARTSIGDVPIAAIPFNVASTLSGIADFGGKVGLSNVAITGSGGKGGKF